MNKSILYILIYVILIFSSSAMGSDFVYCEPQKVTSIRIKQNGDVTYSLKGNGRRLAFKGESDINGRNQIIANMLLTAIDKQYYVQAIYPKGYDCKGDFKTQALSITIDNPKH